MTGGRRRARNTTTSGARGTCGSSLSKKCQEWRTPPWITCILRSHQGDSPQGCQPTLPESQLAGYIFLCQPPCSGGNRLGRNRKQLFRKRGGYQAGRGTASPLHCVALDPSEPSRSGARHVGRLGSAGLDRSGVACAGLTLRRVDRFLTRVGCFRGHNAEVGIESTEPVGEPSSEGTVSRHRRLDRQRPAQRGREGPLSGPGGAGRGG